jgi:hypothetical protein
LVGGSIRLRRLRGKLFDILWSFRLRGLRVRFKKATATEEKEMTALTNWRFGGAVIRTCTLG